MSEPRPANPSASFVAFLRLGLVTSAESLLLKRFESEGVGGRGLGFRLRTPLLTGDGARDDELEDVGSCAEVEAKVEEVGAKGDEGGK